MRKGSKAWANLYGSGVLGMGDTIYSMDSEKFTQTACPTRGPWFENFMRGSKLWMGSWSASSSISRTSAWGSLSG